MIGRELTTWATGLAVAAVLIATFCVSAIAEQKWGSWSKHTAHLQRELDLASTTRPSLYGETKDGQAWLEYERAIQLATDDRELEVNTRPVTRVELSKAERDTLLANHRETLACLRRGAHARQAREPVDWSRGFEVQPRNLLATRALANLAVTQALAEFERGDHVAGVQTLLDAAQLGRDLMHSHLLIDEMAGAAVLQIATSEAFVQNDLLNEVADEALMELAVGLAVLDDAMARVGPSFRSEAVLFAYSLRNSSPILEDMEPSADMWRYGFSHRWMWADLGHRVVRHADRTVAAAWRPWPECSAHLQRVMTQATAANDPALPALTPTHMALRARFQAIARIRLLRMAVAHHLGEPVPELADPFGDTLCHGDEHGGATRFWSAGPESDRLYLFSRGRS